MDSSEEERTKKRRSVGRPKIYKSAVEVRNAMNKNKREWYKRAGSQEHVRQYNKEYYQKRKMAKVINGGKRRQLSRHHHQSYHSDGKHSSHSKHHSRHHSRRHSRRHSSNHSRKHGSRHSRRHSSRKHH